MSVETDVADVFALMLSSNASEGTARTVALALCRELMPHASELEIRDTAARAIATVRIRRANSKEGECSGERHNELAFKSSVTKASKEMVS